MIPGFLRSDIAARGTHGAKPRLKACNFFFASLSRDRSCFLEELNEFLRTFIQ